MKDRASAAAWKHLWRAWERESCALPSGRLPVAKRPIEDVQRLLDCSYLGREYQSTPTMADPTTTP